MSEIKPFEVDKLLDKVPGKYALALLLGRRAVQIKRSDRDELYPLQRAYEEVMRGEVGITYEAPDTITDPLSLDALVLEEEAPAESHMESSVQQGEEPPEGFSVEIGEGESQPGAEKAKSPLELLAGALSAAAATDAEETEEDDKSGELTEAESEPPEEE